jgi:hypothetical protein
MASDLLINGETTVQVIGAAGSAIATLQELGLTEDQIRITPRWRHRDMNVDDFGTEIPPDVMWMLADCLIRMTLVYVDRAILNAVLKESMCGGAALGSLKAAGTPMGGGEALKSTENHYIELRLTPAAPVIGRQWTFPATYLAEQPYEEPLGVERSLVKLTFRAIPFVPFSAGAELLSTGATLWTN